MLALGPEDGSDAALPAFQDTWLALPLAHKLRLQTWLVRLGEVLSVRRDLRVGMKDGRKRSVRLGVVAIRQAEDPV